MSHPSFWGRGFSAIPKELLYPSDDVMEHITKQIKEHLYGEEASRTGETGHFLKAWSELEHIVLSTARLLASDVTTVRGAIRTLSEQGIEEEFLANLDQASIFRNRLVHSPSEVADEQIRTWSERVEQLKEVANKVYDMLR